MCTTCAECTNIDNKLFAYNNYKQAYIKETRAGTFKTRVGGGRRVHGADHPPRRAAESIGAAAGEIGQAG